MPVFRGQQSDIVWHCQMNDGSWLDYPGDECHTIEAAWGRDEEVLIMARYPNHVFYLPMVYGGLVWCQGLGPFQLNRETGTWRIMRRCLVVSQVYENNGHQ
jgi:hypothetical protein